METLDDLKRAVQKLRHRVNELEDGSAKKAEAVANAITSGGHAHEGLGRFSAECNRSERARRNGMQTD